MKNIFDYAREGDYFPVEKTNIKVSMNNGICDIYDSDTGVIYQFNENKCKDWVKKSTPSQLFQQLYL